MTPATPNIAWVLRDEFNLSKKDLRHITGASHEEVDSWLAKRGSTIEDKYLVCLHQAGLVLHVFKEGKVFKKGEVEKIIIGFLRARHLWADGSSMTARAAIRASKGEEVLEKARVAVREQQKGQAKEKRTKKHKNAKHRS